MALSEEFKVDRSELSSAVFDLESDAKCENLIPIGDSTDDDVAVSTVDPKYGPETFDKKANSWGGRRCISLSLTNVSFLFFLTRHRHAVILLTKVTGLKTLTGIVLTTNNADWTSSEALLVDLLFEVGVAFDMFVPSFLHGGRRVDRLKALP